MELFCILIVTVSALIQRLFAGEPVSLPREAGLASQGPLTWHNLDSVLAGSLSWDGPDLAADHYTYYLDATSKLEIEEALSHFKALSSDGREITTSNFPLPTLGQDLSRYASGLSNEKGFFILSGLDSSDHNVEDNILIFLGISSYIGNKRGKQDHRGSMLMHLQEAKQMTVSQQERPARDSNTGLQFHADLWTDILAMQVISNAATGGEHVISPAYTIFKEMQDSRPDLAALLMEPVWTFDPHSLHFNPQKRPLVFWHEDHLLFNFGRLHVFGDKDLMRPDLTALQLEALDMLQVLARKHQLTLHTRPGDLFFVNNFAVLHGREAFTDTEEQARHLVRIWLKNEDLAWKLPSVLEEGNQKVFYDESGEEIWELVPKARKTFQVRDKFGP